MFRDLFEKFDFDTTTRMKAIFSSIFVLQNRMQTAGDKILAQISMKQWLLIAMTESCPEPRNLTNIGNLMGCSRQNVKKLALSLEKKEFVRILSGSNHSICIELTEKVTEYAKEIGLQQMQVLKLLFADFNEKEIQQLFKLYAKFFAGVDRVEKYAEEIGHK
ncbi:MAG: MarR family transcriptional regulator [Lachnospiraceae bacterium]|jgi:DNA-binding MarR family transcriptional regulator|nr:MarR family transcriptional regulator [Lachnospiraceae bacterium]